jgi:DNA-binding response OmpR family regulator
MEVTGKKRILIVEDEPELAELLPISLEREGMDCLIAEDGNRGLELARRREPDLIILDIMMPGMNGYKVARLLKFDAR